MCINLLFMLTRIKEHYFIRVLIYFLCKHKSRNIILYVYINLLCMYTRIKEHYFICVSIYFLIL